MSDWREYRLGDFLLFSPETYWRLFELHNAALWPVHVAAMLALALLFRGAVAGWRWTGVAVGVGLAAAWACVTWIFLAQRYAPINWAIGHVTPFGWAEAGLLLLAGPALSFRDRRAADTAAGIVLTGLALAYPALGVLAGRPILQSEVAGLAPDPTAVATLGLLALARPGWPRFALTLLPALWLVLSAATLVAMGAVMGWLPLAAVTVAILPRLSRRRREIAGPGRSRE